MTTKKATRGAPAPRAYSSPRRQAQAQQTRRDVLRAAVRLFGDYGWSGTTLAAVAAEAGVAVETLYSTFGTKKALLREAFDVSLAGDNEPIALADRPEYTRLAEGTLAERIRAGARLQSETVGRSARVWRAMRDAASGDTEIARWCADLEKARRDQHRDSLRRVLGRTMDGPQLDLIWAILSPEVYLKLRDERGWSAARYETWISRAVLALAGELPAPG